MKMNPPLLHNFIQVIILLASLLLQLHLLAANFWGVTAAVVRCIESERQALLEFKAGLVDDHGVLSSWGMKDHQRDCCKWKGVACSNQTGHVEMVDLHADLDEHGNALHPLGGEIRASLMGLENLKFLNLSWNDFEGIPIPEFIGSLSNLRYLDLSYSMFGGKIPSQLGNLPRLRYLNLRDNYLLEGAIPYQFGNLSQLQYLDLATNSLKGTIPHQLGNLLSLQKLDLGYSLDALQIDKGGEWLFNLTSLTHLDLSAVLNLNYSHNWLQMISKLPNLKHLGLSQCGLSDLNLVSLSTSTLINSSTSLSFIDLSSNTFTSSKIFHWVSNFSSNLVELDLGDNHLEGPIPDDLGNVMSSVEWLYLYGNELRGGIPGSFRNMCNLRTLNLGKNSLNEELSVIIHNLSGCGRHSLETLMIAWNQITGTLPDFSIFSSLKALYLDVNRLSGKIPQDIRFPSQLEYLIGNSNSLEGMFTDSHFANMSKLKQLDFSYNPLTLTFSQNWNPSFQAEDIRLRSCKLGPHFPKWLQAQSNFTVLDISNAGISDVVPEWFWACLSPKLFYLNISLNTITGTIPNFPIGFIDYPVIIDLSSNSFQGPIPLFLRSASRLDLSRNKFSESHMFLCASGIAEKLSILDFSYNQLSGLLPNCWIHFKPLVYLDLSNNFLSGEVPTSLGSLLELEALILRNNSFVGELPFSLNNCTKLVLLDAGENRLSGTIPSWIGDALHKLQILSLRKNLFFGSLPMNLCYLTTIQLLDLSINNLSGQIIKCLNNFTAMAQESSSEGQLLGSHSYTFTYRDYGSPYEDLYDLNALLMWKGVVQMFKHNVLLLKSIDLSSNHLTGVIPTELGSLVELVSLNLSRNKLMGEIPSELGRLTSLDVLDLSRNQLFGRIPSSLALIDRLAVLDLSNNHLSGKIPTGTQLQSFNASSYEGNPDLCGKPLEKKCPEEETTHHVEVQQDQGSSLFSKELYMGMALGFITGFWGIFGSILLNRSWRHAYFMFLNKIADSIYVMVAVNMHKCQRCFKLKKAGEFS